MAEAVHAEAGADVLMIGCTTSGEFTTGGRGSGVVVSALGGYDASVRAVPYDSVDLYEAGVIAASSLDDIDAEHRVVLLLCLDVRCVRKKKRGKRKKDRRGTAVVGMGWCGLLRERGRRPRGRGGGLGRSQVEAQVRRRFVFLFLFCFFLFWNCFSF
jgi:hypothetical protein